MLKTSVTGLVALAGMALKLYQWYFSRPLWLDEEMILLNARDRTFTELAGLLWLNQAAPIGWLALQHGVTATFGTSDRAVRALPVLFGIATIWVAWWMAARWLKPVAAAVLVALCGFAQWMTFYALEVKPYSADAFMALFLPALAIWAIEETAPTAQIDLRRTAVWWVAATLGQWLSFGATFVTPACALTLCATAWRRAGLRTACVVAAQGGVWLACFAVHYMLSIRVASGDEFLRKYWVAGFPPGAAGMSDALRWLIQQAQPIASHPGGTTLWWLFWVSAAYGIAVLLAKRPAMGVLLLSVPISASLLAVLRVIPLSDRLALWIIPALYAGVAVAAGDVFERIHAARSYRNWALIAVAIVFSTGAWLVVGNVVQLGEQRIIVYGDNHGLRDDRAVRMMMNQRQPGDVLLTNHYAEPAVWWYGDIDISDPNAGSHLADGAPLLRLEHVLFGLQGCRRRTQMRSLSTALAGAPRAIVYLGFASGVPPGFEPRVLHDLARLGTRVFYSPAGEDGMVAIYDLRHPPEPGSSDDLASLELSEGCIHARTARRW
jgi:hypothetical protein